jgi:hypothetical protein
MNDDKKNALAEIKKLFGDADEGFEEGMIGELKTNPPEDPDFPYLITFTAVVKDALDIASAGLLTWIFSAFFAFILWMWWSGKIGLAQRMLLKWGVKRAVAFIGADAVPVLGVLPFATLFVVIAHNKEKKIVQLLLASLEKVKKAGL